MEVSDTSQDVERSVFEAQILDHKEALVSSGEARETPLQS